jgi:hypothetical protein
VRFVVLTLDGIWKEHTTSQTTCTFRDFFHSGRTRQ